MAAGATDPVVIVGTGLAGYTLARELRKLDAETPLVLVTADDGAFYSKPMLSNALAEGKDADALVLDTAEGMAAKLGARILTGTPVERLDPAARTVHTAAGPLRYRDLVLAVGAVPIRPPMAGEGAGEVLSVNNRQDYARFRTRLEGARRVAIIGPGLIGCEFANDLLAAGRAPTVIGPDPWPISTLLPEAAGRALARGLEAAGVRLLLGRTVPRVERADGGLRLQLDDGGGVEADLVLSAVGLRPDTRLAEAAGLEVGRGIRVDRFLRTSAPHVYALGDCAEVEGRVLPFVMPIMHGARALARTLAGEPTPATYPPMPVVIKTPAHPVAVLPPPPGEGAWRLTDEDGGVRMLWVAADGTLQGFALTGRHAAERQRLTARVGQPAADDGG
ncbi:NAD(P)/FAD-dependent oxidoreductase [Inmirania thermothiophila]|uniref:Rubredoxin-NAD+ reductase n=1 Tax=Inmirania thermothiophila TaxID=1750597 RepID=A0A3N1Y1F8_9GAMM|nr:FAD-dependent oxidoreductase [Inmirania thermothiophila]ROR32381.1 rubredoxin-NAD+ reductase [Inmirania thermothiophila]